MIKTELKSLIKEYLGHPYVKIELHDTQLNNIINRTKNIHQKWAISNANQEVFFTIPLSGGERHYELPAGVTDVITMKDFSTGWGNANQLFTVQNFMMNNNMLRFVQGGNFASMIDYHLGLEFLDLLEKYTVSDYAWKYHKFNNTLTLSPVPSAGDSWDSSQINYMLIRSFMAEGYNLDSDNINTEWNEYIYDDQWFQEYCIALAKITLGMTRRKFSGNTSIGNTGIELDGDSLVSEGKEEKEMLEEKLKTEEVYEGWEIFF